MRPFLKSYISLFELIALPAFTVFVCISFYTMARFSWGVLLLGSVLGVGYFIAGVFLFAYPARGAYKVYPLLCGVAYGTVVVGIMHCALQFSRGQFMAIGAAVPLGLLALSFLYHWWRQKMDRYDLRLHAFRVLLLSVLLGWSYLNWDARASSNRQDARVAETICDHGEAMVGRGIGMLIWGEDNDINGDPPLPCPYLFKPGYGILQYVVIAETDSTFQVLHAGDQIGQIVKDTSFQFKNWEEYLTSLPLGAQLKSGGNDFNIVEVKGDSCRTSTGHWIQWRSEDELLIDFYSLM